MFALMGVQNKSASYPTTSEPLQQRLLQHYLQRPSRTKRPLPHVTRTPGGLSQGRIGLKALVVYHQQPPMSDNVKVGLCDDNGDLGFLIKEDHRGQPMTPQSWPLPWPA